MNKYMELGRELDKILERRREISSPRCNLSPLRGHEEEHERLTKQAEEIRKQMRRARYGTEE